MEYKQLKELFSRHERGYPKTHFTAYITFSSFGPNNSNTYSWKERTYVISSENKAFEPNKGGYSIFGSCLDGSDHCLRLDQYIKEEFGGENGWVVEDCCIVGYLLPDCDVFDFAPPRLFFFHEEALDYVLLQVAEAAGMNYERLRTDKAAQERLLWEAHSASEDDSILSIEGADADRLWGIHPVRLYCLPETMTDQDRKSTRLNSSHS